jgi:hypothetical protein
MYVLSRNSSQDAQGDFCVAGTQAALDSADPGEFNNGSTPRTQPLSFFLTQLPAQIGLYILQDVRKRPPKQIDRYSTEVQAGKRPWPRPVDSRVRLQSHFFQGVIIARTMSSRFEHPACRANPLTKVCSTLVLKTFLRSRNQTFSPTFADVRPCANAYDLLKTGTIHRALELRRL